MAQTAKYIDVTRTFLPVDPNSFPESLHTSSREEGPENRIPVMAYKGFNFLPTSYGYKSYFGTNQKVDISALAARVDYVFIFQNQSFENILIALTDTGVWTKKGEAAGAWTNDVPVVPDVDPNVHYEWTYVVIANVLYTYQQGKANYQKFVHSSTLGVEITSIVPNFLNMAAQVGIFRAAGRLAFWDSSDSVGWANLDDFADFTPSLETLAGNVIFADIQGRIVTIKSHGPGFIIYATRSIIYVSQNVENLFQWKPQVILPSCGISYPRQVAEASPDTVHFAYTQEGLKKIEKATEETIVPEITDFLKEYSKPVYVRILEGRYLFLELLDADYVTGLVQITDEVVPAATYTFAGSSVIADNTPDNSRESICSLSDAFDKGSFNAFPVFPDRNTSLPMQPVYTCYLSNNGVKDNGNIVWGPGVCPTVDPNGVEVNMSPGGLTTDKLTQTTANKTAVTGGASLFDRWTITRFVQTQMAIWEAEERNLKEFNSAAVNRSKTGTKITLDQAVCVPVGLARAECTIGRYPSKFSAPKFGYSKCQFWLTRMAIGVMDLVRVKANTTTCGPAHEGFSLWSSSQAPGSFATAALAAAASGQALGSITSTSPGGQPLSYNLLDAPPLFGGSVSRNFLGNVFDKTERMDAYNKGVDVEIAPIPESPYCELTHWRYTDTLGNVILAPAAACAEPTSYPAGVAGTKPGAAEPPISKLDGTLCGRTYTPETVDGYNAVWPSTSVTIPSGSFLLQKGSQAPVYPTFEGALVYDLQLKKWGKMKLRYKQLLDYSPVNSSLNGVIPFNVFGIMAGAMGADGKISLFDAYPSESYISYGKVGYARNGNTSPEEVTAHFRVPSTGAVKVETSLEGKNLAAGFTKSQSFTNATEVTLNGAYPGRWANIEINGIFDLQYLEYRGFTQGRR